jgi:hypothetical protein
MSGENGQDIVTVYTVRLKVMNRTFETLSEGSVELSLPRSTSINGLEEQLDDFGTTMAGAFDGLITTADSLKGIYWWVVTLEDLGQTFFMSTMNAAVGGAIAKITHDISNRYDLVFTEKQGTESVSSPEPDPDDSKDDEEDHITVTRTRRRG